MRTARPRPPTAGLVRALASPASLKGVLTAAEAASALAAGFARVPGTETEVLPIADGGGGTAEVLGARIVRRCEVHDAFGRPREAPIRASPDGAALIESAEVIPLDEARRDVFAASSRGLGELIALATGYPRLVVCLGGTANMDGGAGLLEVLDELPAPTMVLCDVHVGLLE